VMFGMVAATGVRILSKVDFAGNRANLLIAAIAIGFGMIPLVAPAFFSKMPEQLKPLLESGILLTSIVAVALNLYYNGLGDRDAAADEAARAAHAAEA
jgi:uric acid transporter